ncbi:hypothetical protein TPDSL_13730 [Terrisporobacter petrolearius]|uniref:hypothetical protein n=1 Tax=Terrisporobacter petrolearius TaxID=1460447 RepID=UPI0033692EF8
MKIGDNVRLIDTRNVSNDNLKIGDTGTIVTFVEIKSLNNGKRKSINVGVQFDRKIKGHACDGLGQFGYCAWIPRKKLVQVGGNNE